MDLNVFEFNQEYVLDAFLRGDFDYIDGASKIFEKDFFSHIAAEGMLAEMAETYPTPRRKQEVPMWFHIASQLAMRLHGEHGYHASDMVIQTGGMIQAFSPKLGAKVEETNSGDSHYSCKGFNNKNSYDRRTPCDQDTVRKLAKDTDTNKLMDWFNTDVVAVWKKQKAFDEEGLFIGDGSYLFVPNKTEYEGSSLLRFDEGNHPVGRKAYEKMTPEQKAKCSWRRCYKMITLLHVNRSLDYQLFVSVRVLPGKTGECPVLYDMVQQFVKAAGKGVMRRLILDRAFLDGEAISRCKKELGVDVLVPLKRNMDLYQDAVALFEQPDMQWTDIPVTKAKAKSKVKHQIKNSKPPRPRPKPKAVLRREAKRQKTLAQKPTKPQLPPNKVIVRRQTAAIGNFSSWSTCTVPLSVTANREHYADGSVKTWFLVDTRNLVNPVMQAQTYHLRTAIEERFRQLKCFVDLMKFTSKAFSLVTAQVVFVLLTYSLLQLFLWRTGKQDMNNMQLDQVQRKLLPHDNYVLIYFENYYAKFHFYEYTDILVTDLSEEARKKIGEKCRRRRKEMLEHDLLFRNRP